LFSSTDMGRPFLGEVRPPRVGAVGGKTLAGRVP
jgi:hypothetical protein